MFTFLLWCLLLVVCWPLALAALVLYPIVWLILLPFRLVGITLEAVFSFLKALLPLPNKTFPFRLRKMRGIQHLHSTMHT